MKVDRSLSPACLIVNADDFGYFRGVNQGIIEAATRGIVTATGVFATAERFSQDVPALRDCAVLDAGVHLNLTDGWPLTPDMRKRLAHWGGRFPGKFTIARAVLTGAVPAWDVEVEWRAQIERCLGAGLKLQFLNSHEHIHMLPVLFPMLCKIPIQYARRVVGRRVYGGASTYLPLRVNTAGVIPVIFASSMLAIPQTLSTVQALQDVQWVQNILRQVEYSAPLYNLLYFALIIFFCFFYVSIIFNPMDQADNMKKYGGFVPGIRPGKKTAEYIDRILTRLTFGGAVYLGLISLLPVFLISGFRVQTLPWIGPTLDSLLPNIITQGLNVKFFFGGTSLLIVVGVAMDTVQQIESQLIMRHYDGLMKGTRLRGRRG